MFTGLIQESARVVSVRRPHSGESDSLVLQIESKLPESSQWLLGASIALNGVCLTLTQRNSSQAGGQVLEFELSPETLNRTHFSQVGVGDWVHLERSLNVGDPLGGHWVSGHVDGCGFLKHRRVVDAFHELVFALEGSPRQSLAPYLVEKGSVAVDGVSLTVNSVKDFPSEGRTEFSVMLIPHTLQMTRFGSLNLGNKVHLEADLLAKYVCRYNEFQRQS